jgi:NAD(P)-dependent dehydrogenase (short-subunit alcohol dehydrogenase family)
MKVAVITGASRGFGRSLVEEFTNHNWQVVGTGRSEQPGDFLESATYHQFDASDAAECEAFWKQLHEKYPDGEVCLINNAGAYVKGGLTEAAPEDFEKQMDSIYFSSVYMTRGLVSTISKARIINIVSAEALLPKKGALAYGAAKAAQKHFFQSLQQELDAKRYAITNLYPKDIASHGPNPEAIDPVDLAAFIREQAENEATYVLRDVTLYTR